MLINSGKRPDLSIYVLGGKLISLLREKKQYRQISVELLYSIFNDINKESKISIEYFLYILDWLYILGLIDNNNYNEIKICF